MSAELAVVIPIFNAVSQTERCLQALAQTTRQADSVKIILIDDASTDIGISKLLRHTQASMPGWQIKRLDLNRGFVAAANLGFELAAGCDVVLLNSDTIPAGDWLARIQKCADSDTRIASITPFSNNGEIVSLPEFCQAAPVPSDPERWAQACASVQPPQYPELPTAVGFCMYLRRACIAEIGGFDEVVFGRGYGEENDWCMRATAAGWKHVLCDDAFVAHEGNASFGPLGIQPGEQSMQRLLQRHPQYLEHIHEFIQRDPLKAIRKRVLQKGLSWT